MSQLSGVMLIFAESLNQGQWRQVEDNEDGHKNVVFGNGGHKNNMAKGINELDLSDCVQCTPSYRHLPDDVSASETLDSFIHNTQFDVAF